MSGTTGRAITLNMWRGILNNGFWPAGRERPLQRHNQYAGVNVSGGAAGFVLDPKHLPNRP